MKKEIMWRSNLSEAFLQAKKEEKIVLIDWSDAPSCVGCVSLENNTYPDDEVINYLTEHFVSVQLKQREQLEVFNNNRIIWTPTITFCTVTGAEYDRFVGFLPPQEFLPRVKLAEAHFAMNTTNYEKAVKLFNDITVNHQKSFVAADAFYWLGVAKWKLNRNFEELTGAWKKLTEQYPNSEAAVKASCLFHTDEFYREAKC